MAPGHGSELDETIRVLTATSDDRMHSTVERALELLAEGPNDRTVPRVLRAETPAETLALAAREQPRIIFLDVTLGGGAGISLVHFLQATVPRASVVALVPTGTTDEAKLAEQASALGAAWVLIGELTGDEVLGAFGRIAPSQRFRSLPPWTDAGRVSLLPGPSAPLEGGSLAEADLPTAGVEDAEDFVTLDLVLRRVEAGAPVALQGFLSTVRMAIDRCSAADRRARATIQDAATSAYSFAYFVDVAGREIDLSRRHARRFALLCVEAHAIDREADRAVSDAIELILGTVRDTDVLARADERELLVLLPETGTKGARTLRRRILDRMLKHREGAGFRLGLAAFPFDGEDLSRILRVARRRAERWAELEVRTHLPAMLADVVEWLALDAGAEPPVDIVPNWFQALDLPLREAWSLLDVLVRDATRGGDATIVLHAPADEAQVGLGLGLSLRATVLEAIGPAVAGSGSLAPRTNDRASLSLVTGVSRLGSVARFEGLEVVAVLAEHGNYALIGRVRDGRLTALHSHELPVAELLLRGLEQPVIRRGSVPTSNHPSSPLGIRSRSESNLRAATPLDGGRITPIYDGQDRRT